MKRIHCSKLAPAISAIAALLLPLQAAKAGGEGFSQSTISGKETFESKSSDLGLGKFSANPFHVTVTVRNGYDDNVNLSSFDTQDSFFTNAAIGVTYNFGSPRTRIALSGNVSGTYYWDNGNNRFGGSSDDFVFNTFLALSVTHRATPRLTLGADINLSYLTRPGFDTFNNNNNFFNVERRSQNYFQTTDKFTLGYAWSPRFSTVSSYTLGYINYDDATISIFEDRFEHTLGNEFRFLILPTTTLVAEYRFGIADYVNNNNRGSYSHFFLGGADHSFSPRFNVSVRAGLEVRHFDDNPQLVFGNVDDTRTAPYAESTVNYALAKNTSIAWFNRYSLEQPNVPDALSRETFRTGLSIRHSFSPRLSAGLNFAYQHDSYDATFTAPSFAEDSFDISLTARYAINHNWSVDAGYQHSELTSDASLFREFARNQYWLGVSFLW